MFYVGGCRLNFFLGNLYIINKYFLKVWKFKILDRSCYFLRIFWSFFVLVVEVDFFFFV